MSESVLLEKSHVLLEVLEPVHECSGLEFFVPVGSAKPSSCMYRAGCCSRVRLFLRLIALKVTKKFQNLQSKEVGCPGFRHPERGNNGIF